jgi:SAM-dependent methyltransferase
MDRNSMVALQGLDKTPEVDPSGGIYPLLGLLGCVTSIKPGASILDLGCGVGNGVRTLLALGYDAHGVDIFEYWGADAALYWEADPVAPSAEIAARLKVARIDPYALPFADGSFDHVVSAQVLEHVSDLDAVFAELRRVLRPGGVSVHLYPGHWTPTIREGHIGVPVAGLCKYPAWLKAAAIVGFRSPRQRGMGWREVYRLNREQMRITHYRSRAQVLRAARRFGLEAWFANDAYVARSGTGWTRLHRALSRVGLGGAAVLAAKLRLQPMLALRRL